MTKCESCGSWQEDCDCPIPPWRMDEYDPTCDGCAQPKSECLCDVDITDALDCNHPSHPGCRKCEVRR